MFFLLFPDPQSIQSSDARKNAAWRIKSSVKKGAIPIFVDGIND